MALEIEGKILSKLTAQGGQSARGQWAKQEFIIEYQDGQYSEKLCLHVWGQDKINELNNYQVGDSIKVNFKPTSREFNGRWYTDLRVWKISSPAAGTAPAPAASHPAVNAPSAPLPETEDFSNFDNNSDDLPF
jgi:hypothetical protein